LSRTTEKNLERRQAEIADVKMLLEQLEGAFRCAEDCERPDEFDANLGDMEAAAQAILGVIREVRAS